MSAFPEPVDLTHGGELAITEHEDGYVLHLTRNGFTVHTTLSALDVQAIRALTGDLVLARLNEHGLQEFMDSLERPS
jgi:uncharacterized protein with GYD domain